LAQVKATEIPPAETRAKEPGLARGGNVRARGRQREVAKRLVVIATDSVALAVSRWIAAIGVERLLQVPASAVEPGKYLLFYLPLLLVVIYLLERGKSVEVRRPEKR